MPILSLNYPTSNYITGVDGMERVQRLAENKLKQCRRLMRTAGQRLTDLQSPTISDMPHSSAYGNVVEDRIVRQVSAQQELGEIYRAITWLSTDEQRLVLAKYFDNNRPTDRMIMIDMGVSERTFYRLHNRALEEFAESYMAGSLFQNA